MCPGCNEKSLQCITKTFVTHYSEMSHADCSIIFHASYAKLLHAQESNIFNAHYAKWFYAAYTENVLCALLKNVSS